MNVDLNFGVMKRFQLSLKCPSIQGGPMEIGTEASANDEANQNFEIILKFDNCSSSNKVTIQVNDTTCQIKTDILFKNSGKDIDRVIFTCDYYNR